MKNQATYRFKTQLLLLLIFLLSIAPAVHANVYVIFYATYKGKTGHSGIAVDSYDILVRDIVRNNTMYSEYDSVSTGNLIYFDLWPKGDAFIRSHLKKDLEPVYFQLPRSSNEARITINSLLAKGLPHKEFQPVDGLIEIETKPYQDYRLLSFLIEVSEAQKCFNAQLFNCTDFVCKGLSVLTGKKFTARETVLFSCFSTPNALFKKLEDTKELAIHIIKHPGEQMEGSFLTQKIIPELKNRIRKKTNEQQL
jgi:ribosomal protein L21E